MRLSRQTRKLHREAFEQFEALCDEINLPSGKRARLLGVRPNVYASWKGGGAPQDISPVTRALGSPTLRGVQAKTPPIRGVNGNGNGKPVDLAVKAGAYGLHLTSDDPKVLGTILAAVIASHGVSQINVDQLLNN
jgi:hypothetical protein